MCLDSSRHRLALRWVVSLKGVNSDFDSLPFLTVCGVPCGAELVYGVFVFVHSVFCWFINAFSSLTVLFLGKLRVKSFICNGLFDSVTLCNKCVTPASLAPQWLFGICYIVTYKCTYIYIYRGGYICIPVYVYMCICVCISRNIRNMRNILYSIRVCGVTSGVTERYSGTKTALCSTLDPNRSGFLLACAP
jgi:hypothetical protein